MQRNAIDWMRRHVFRVLRIAFVCHVCTFQPHPKYAEEPQVVARGMRACAECDIPVALDIIATSSARLVICYFVSLTWLLPQRLNA